MSRETFAVSFLGCKVSQADAMLARERLLAAGAEEAPPDEAAVHVINTCCITSQAEAKSRTAVRRALKAGASRVLVSGCAANLDAKQFAEIDESVEVFTGTADEVALAIGTAVGGCADLEHDVLARERRGQLSSFIAGERGELTPSFSRTRGFVKVQDGCDCHCAYCIIPTVRGPARSRPVSAILAEVESRVAAGQPEMVMTGISVGDYRDPERGLELGELLMEAARVPGVERVRLSSVEVIHVKGSLIRALAGEPNVCPHLHVPMQSGDEAVLADMGRHYDRAGYLDAIARLREAAPDVNLTTDVIVGFPTEDDAAFERTLDAVREAGITRVHTFPYSPRPGTRAADLGDRVHPDEKKRRSREMRGLSEALSRLHRSQKLGSNSDVLVDKVAETQCSGYTADYTRVYLPADAAERGAVVTARLEELQADGLRGVPG